MDIKLKDGRVAKVPDGASAADIDEFLKLNNVERAPEGSTAGGLLGSAVTDAVKAIPRFLGSALSGAEFLGDVNSPRAALTGGKSIKPPPNPEYFANKLEGALPPGTLHKPEGALENIVGAAAGGLVGGPISGPEGALANSTLYGALPAAGSEAVGQLLHNLPDWVPYKGKIEGAGRMLAGALLPGVRSKKVEPSRLEAAKTLSDKYGIVPTAGQIESNKAQQRREIIAQPNINEDQSGEFTKATTKMAGEPVKTVTGGTKGSYIDRGLDRTGQNIEDIANRTEIDPQALGNGQTQPQLYNDLASIVMKATQEKRPDDIKRVLDIFKGVDGRYTPDKWHQPGGEEFHNALFGSGGPGAVMKVPGQDYARIRTALHETAKAEGTSPTAAKMMRDVADALDNGMENTIRSSGNPADVGAWNKARKEYANMLVVEDARNKMGRDGPISPDQLEASTKAVRGSRPFLRGYTDQGELSGAAQQVLNPIDEAKQPVSTLPSKLGMWGGALGIPAAIAAHHYGLPGFGGAADPWVGLIAGREAGRDIGEWMTGGSVLPPGLSEMSPSVQSWRKYQLVPKTDFGAESGPFKVGPNLADRQLSMMGRALITPDMKVEPTVQNFIQTLFGG